MAVSPSLIQLLLERVPPAWTMSVPELPAPTPMSIDVTATVTLTYGMTIDQVQQPITDAINAYLLSVRKGWGIPADPATNTYIFYIFRAQISTAALAVQGVINITDVLLNGAAADITINQTGQVQSLPVIGAVSLNGA